MYKHILFIFIISLVLPNFLYAATSKEEQLLLLKKLDKLDTLDKLDVLDFLDAIDAANECTAQRQFECTLDNIGVAEKLAISPNQLATVRDSKNAYNEELEQIKHEKRLLEEKQRLAEEKRRRLEQERRIAQERENAQRDDGWGSAFKFIGGMVAGTAASLEAKHSGLSRQAQDDIGLDAMMPFLDEEDRRNIERNRNSQNRRETVSEMWDRETSEINTSLGDIKQKQAKLKQQRQYTAKGNVFDAKGYYDLSSCQMGDIQLKSMCGTANLYYIAYKKALQDGFSATEAEKNWQAHRRSAEQTIMFYERTRAAMIREEEKVYVDQATSSKAKQSGKKIENPCANYTGPGACSVSK